MTTTPRHLKTDSPHGGRRAPAPRTVAVILAVAVPLALVSLTSSGASASSALPPVPAGFASTPTPASGVFTVTGRSWGHRIGMSQVGAQYAGRTGVSTAAILAHYYPWRLTPVTAAHPGVGLHLQYSTAPTGTGWTTVGAVVPLGSGFTATGASSGVRVELPNGQTRTEPSTVLRTVDRSRSTRWTTVSYVDLQTYVGVVTAAEIGPSSAPSTLGAQAVAARTYATRVSTVNGPTHTWDICSTRCE